MNIIAAIILWVGHNVPAIGQHIGCSNSEVWVNLGGFVWFVPM